MLKLFVDADTNMDGLVSRAHFSQLVDAAAKIPRDYGYAPPDSEMYKNAKEKEQARSVNFSIRVQPSTDLSLYFVQDCYVRLYGHQTLWRHHLRCMA